MGVLVGSIYYNLAIGGLANGQIILLCLFLTILSEIGDLVFSSIKRYFGKKDFEGIQYTIRFKTIASFLISFLFIFAFVVFGTGSDCVDEIVLSYERVKFARQTDMPSRSTCSRVELSTAKISP
mgnify:CR=1 FL=1